MVLQDDHQYRAMADAILHSGARALEDLLHEGADVNAHNDEVSCCDNLAIIFWLTFIAACLYAECISKNMAHVCTP